MLRQNIAAVIVGDMRRLEFENGGVDSLPVWI
jgi:hypothetical protein